MDEQTDKKINFDLNLDCNVPKDKENIKANIRFKVNVEAKKNLNDCKKPGSFQIIHNEVTSFLTNNPGLISGLGLIATISAIFIMQPTNNYFIGYLKFFSFIALIWSFWILFKHLYNYLIQEQFFKHNGDHIIELSVYKSLILLILLFYIISILGLFSDFLHINYIYTIIKTILENIIIFTLFIFFIIIIESIILLIMRLNYRNNFNPGLNASVKKSKRSN